MTKSNGMSSDNGNGSAEDSPALILGSTRSLVSVDYSHQPDPAHGTSTITVATFNLVATIVGGGVLSLPFAFSKCGGALWGIGWMLLAAFCTDQSCVWLCWCARPNTITRTPSAIADSSRASEEEHVLMLSSYGQVGKAAFGPILEVCISALLFVFLVFVLIAYMVLVKDIWTPVVLGIFLPTALSQESTSTILQQEADWSPMVMLAIIILMSPFLVQRTLHSLRFNCYVGFASVSILCLALVYHALHQEASAKYANVLWSYHFWFQPPDSIQDVLIAFPIIMLAYLCHFNVNPVQKALLDPTPPRVHTVIHSSMIACGSLMTLFAIGGYAYVMGSNDVSTRVVYGNILLNCEEQQQQENGQVDVLLLLGRLGCGTTIMLAMAMMLLPCRDSLLEVLDIIIRYHHHTATINSNHDDIPASEATPLIMVENGTDDHKQQPQQQSSIFNTPPPPSLSDNNYVHYTVTLFIVAVCYLAAIKVPGVAIVWSLCGSSMAFTIAFILPAACYLQMIHQREQQGGSSTSVLLLPSNKVLAWIVLVVSILAAIVCTMQTIQSMK